MTVRRLNFGCGQVSAPGWINCDKGYAPGVDIICDIRHGLPLETASLDCAVSVHALPEIPYPDLDPVLWELWRVLKPGGVLRLGLPDLDRAIQAYLHKQRDYFLVPDQDVESLGGKLIVQLIWYGRSRTPFTWDFIEELLHKAGFRQVHACNFRETHSPYADIVELDNREPESFFVEAVK